MHAENHKQQMHYTTTIDTANNCLQMMEKANKLQVDMSSIPAGGFARYLIQLDGDSRIRARGKRLSGYVRVNANLPLGSQ